MRQSQSGSSNNEQDRRSSAGDGKESLDTNFWYAEFVTRSCNTLSKYAADLHDGTRKRLEKRRRAGKRPHKRYRGKARYDVETKVRLNGYKMARKQDAEIQRKVGMSSLKNHGELCANIVVEQDEAYRATRCPGTAKS